MRRRRDLGAAVALALVSLGACGGGGASSSSGSSAPAATFEVRRETFVDSARGNAKVLLEGWASRGYVVAAPRLPPDRLNQPGDVSFVLTEILRLSGAATGPYAGLVDPNRIGVAGHSAGGGTVLGVAFNTCCVDRRVRAGAVLAGDTPPYPGGTYFTGIHTPLLVVHAVADPTVPITEGRRIFADALPPS